MGYRNNATIISNKSGLIPRHGGGRCATKWIQFAGYMRLLLSMIIKRPLLAGVLSLHMMLISLWAESPVIIVTKTYLNLIAFRTI